MKGPGSGRVVRPGRSVPRPALLALAVSGLATLAALVGLRRIRGRQKAVRTGGVHPLGVGTPLWPSPLWDIVKPAALTRFRTARYPGAPDA
jgi:hypothetical protein